MLLDLAGDQVHGVRARRVCRPPAPGAPRTCRDCRGRRRRRRRSVRPGLPSAVRYVGVSAVLVVGEAELVGVGEDHRVGVVRVGASVGAGREALEAVALLRHPSSVPLEAERRRPASKSCVAVALDADVEEAVGVAGGRGDCLLVRAGVRRHGQQGLVLRRRERVAERGVGLEVGDVGVRRVDPRRVDPRRIDPGRVDPRRIDPRRIDPRRIDPRRERRRRQRCPPRSAPSSTSVG